jgi:hypothetical protein
MKKFAVSFLCVLMLFTAIFMSCKKTEPETVLPWRYDVPVLYSANAYNYQTRQIDFNLKIAVLRGNNETEAEIEEYTGIPDTCFKFEDYLFGNTWVKFHINNITYTHDTATIPYFTSIMLDQSAMPESFDVNDKYNQRFQAINGYLNKLKGNGQVMISGFARNGELSGNIEYCNTTPISYWNKSTAKNLLDLTHKTGGTSCLFDALNTMLDQMANVPAQNKSIVVLLINKDDSLGTNNLENVIQKAKLNNIKINLIWLINTWQYVDFTTMTELPARTGGFLVYMGKIYQMSTVFWGLDKLLTKTVNYYNLDVKLTVDAPSSFGITYQDGLKLYYPVSSYYDWNNVQFKLFKNGIK